MNRKWTEQILISFGLTIGSVSSLHAGVMDNLFGSWWETKEVSPKVINVLIVHDQPGVVLEVKGKYKLYDPLTNAPFSTRFIGKRKFVQVSGDSLKWGEDFPGVHQIKIVPEADLSSAIVDGVEYSGNLIVYDIGGTISIVNELPLDQYIKALLTPRFEEKMPHEALAAVVIAARTLAWDLVTCGNNTYWTVDASKVGYGGHLNKSKNNEIEKAIADTSGMVMVKEGKTFAAEWGSPTGGASSKEKKVFSRITLFDAINMANRGESAKQILEKAFPGSSIVLIESISN